MHEFLIKVLIFCLVIPGFCSPRECTGDQNGCEQSGNGDGPKLSPVWIPGP